MTLGWGGKHRVISLVGTIVAACLVLAATGAGTALAAPAAPAVGRVANASSPSLMVTASGATTVGLQVFANVNLACPPGTMYATIYTQTNSGWLYSSTTFTAKPGEAGLTSPTDGQAGISAPATFTWSTVAGVPYYALWVGTTRGGYDVVNSGNLPAPQSSYHVASLPSGRTLYATMLSYVNDTWRYQEISFTTQ